MQTSGADDHYSVQDMQFVGDVVVMDNLNVHKSEAARKLILEKGCEYIFPPAYSPDLNPAEKMWSKVKQLLRGYKDRANEELYKSIVNALKCITASDTEARFSSCG